MAIHEILERLVGANIQLVPAVELTTHFIFERDGYAALVERRGEGFGAVGGAGLLTLQGLAPLIWRGEQPWFVNKSFEQPACLEEVEKLRAFQGDLKIALSGSSKTI